MTSHDRLSNLTRRHALRGISGVLAAAGLPTTVSATAETADSTEQFGPRLIKRGDDSGFQFPYFLYAPQNTRDKPLLVEPVNSGSPSDDMQHHIDAAQGLIQYGLGRTISDELRVPFLVPVIKDPASGDFTNIRTQSLDTETMNIDSGRYARIDRQVVAMVDDARERLSEAGYEIPSEFMLNGFSQSGNFGNNLALLQPERIRSVTAGGVNGMGILPRSEINGDQVSYQIGAADVAELTGTSFDKAAWQDVAQLCYMGANERPPTDDTIPWRDVWSEKQAHHALDVYGETMQQERMVYSDAVYQQADADTRFTVYDGAGHDNSNPKIARDVIHFHQRNLDIPYLTVLRGQTSGAESVDIEAFLPESGSDSLEVRAFVNGSDTTNNPAAIRRGEATRLSLSLTSPLTLGDTLTIAVCPSNQPTLESALYTTDHQIVLDATLKTPTPGDTSIDIEYEVGGDSINLSLLPDNGALYWQRRESLSVGPNESGTETISFAPSAEGLPFEAGDKVELQADFDEQPPSIRSTIETITVGDPDTYDPATRCLSAVSHDAVTVEFASPPTVNAETVNFTCRVESTFDESIDPKLFPDTGSGRWGIDADWDRIEDWQPFGSVEPGDVVTDSYPVPANTFAPADTPALGESVELRAYPDGWGRLDDFVAAACAPISGVRFTQPPTADSDAVSVKYHYPDRFDQSGQIRVAVNNTTVGTIENIAPGTLNSQKVTIDTTHSIGATDSITATIGPAAGTTFDEAKRSVLPADAGSVAFETRPSVLDTQVDLTYHLDAAVEPDRFMTLRLYTPDTPAWGVLLDRVDPGTDATRQFVIDSNEPCVPFQRDMDVTIKLVAWNDPYGTQPLATTSYGSGESPVDNVTTEQFDAVLPNGTDTTLGELRVAVGEWSSNGQIDGVTLTLGELRRIVGHWSRNQ